MIGIGAFMTSATTLLRSKALDIAALFAGYPGRVGCYYGTKFGPSYTDILARNREALGPESLSGGASFTLGASTAATLDASTGQCTVYRTDVSNQSGIRFPAVVGKTYLVDVTVSTGSVYVRSGSIDQTVIATIAAGSRSAVLVVGGGAGYVSLSSVSGASVCRVISVREIVDWQKLVLFDDPNGTVPVFSVFQSSRGRGLLLDASQGLVRGPELVLNGSNLTDTSNWVASGSTISAVGGGLTVTGTGSSARAEQTGRPSGVGKWFEMTATITLGAGVTAAQLNYAKTSDGSTIQSATATVSGQVRMIVQGLESTAQFKCRVLTGTGTATFSGISVKEIPGNHMVQPTAAARGEFSARYNLYDGSDGVNGLAPNGASTSLGYLQESTANSSHFALINNATIPAGASVVTVYRAKTRGRNLRLACTSTAAWVGGSPVATFDLLAGTVVALGGATATIAPVAGQPGVYDCTMVATMGAASTAAHVYPIMTDAAGNTTYTGDGVSGVEFVRRDSRLSADAIPSIPAYQRVTSATDYDEVGFPVYWRGQTDDWAKTRINPNGATKVLAMWGGQKMSDAAEAMLLESSVSSGVTNGAIGVWSSIAGGSNLRVRSRGTSNADMPSSGNTAAPKRLLVNVSADITNDLARIGVNGVVATGVDDQGAGTYTEQDVFFGARAGSSLFSNIREFAPPLILFQPAADPGLSSSQIAALDKAFAKAVGVSL